MEVPAAAAAAVEATSAAVLASALMLVAVKPQARRHESLVRRLESHVAVVGTPVPVVAAAAAIGILVACPVALDMVTDCMVAPVSGAGVVVAAPVVATALHVLHNLYVLASRRAASANGKAVVPMLVAAAPGLPAVTPVPRMVLVDSVVVAVEGRVQVRTMRRARTRGCHCHGPPAAARRMEVPPRGGQFEENTV